MKHTIFIILYFSLSIGMMGCGSDNASQHNNQSIDVEPVSVVVDFDEDGVEAALDCDDSNVNVWVNASYKSVDIDADGIRVAAVGVMCSDGNLPSGYFDTPLSISSSDCNDSDASIWRNALSFYDGDSDGIGAGTSYVACVGSSPAVGTSFLGYDCNDLDGSVWRKSVLYRDIDGDGVGGGVGTLTCLGLLPDSGFSLYGYDPVDNLNDPDSPRILDFDIPKEMLIVSDSVEDGIFF